MDITVVRYGNTFYVVPSAKALDETTTKRLAVGQVTFEGKPSKTNPSAMAAFKMAQTMAKKAIVS